MPARRTRRLPASPDDPRNRLLSALPPAEAGALAAHLVRAEVASGQVLLESAAPVTRVYFPATAVLSVIARVADPGGVEVATVGREGFVGLGVLFGASTESNRCVARVPGLVDVLPADVLRSALADDGPLRALLLRYAQAYLHQVGQRVACVLTHTILQRSALWLLAADDTAGRGEGRGAPREFVLTQEYLADMLGVRREGVSAAARTLRDAGLIRFSRGRIVVLDRSGLEAAACACYGTVASAYREIMDGRPGDGGFP